MKRHVISQGNTFLKFPDKNAAAPPATGVILIDRGPLGDVRSLRDAGEIRLVGHRVDECSEKIVFVASIFDKGDKK